MSMFGARTAMGLVLGCAGEASHCGHHELHPRVPPHNSSVKSVK